MKLDLHTHTKNSDGEKTVLGNVERAIELGLDGVAICDHDSIESWKEIDNINKPIKIIKGVELSTFYENDSVHVLGYYLNKGTHQELETFLTTQKKLRMERVYKIINLLKEHFNIELTYEEIAKYADGVIGRPHIAKAIIAKYPEKNYTIQDIFDLFLGNDSPAYVKSSNLQTKDAIDILHRNNCIAVMAHPLLIKKHNYQDVLSLDFDGIEVFYAYEDPKCNYQEVLENVKDKDLLLTGGSDYHGPNVYDSMGKAYLEDEYAIEFLKRINKLD